MCGISGFINTGQSSIQRELLDLMLDSQDHRGPDARGVYYNNFVGFAHNRLSLLDLSSAGNQPFESEAFVLTYNGEIYNFKELKSELPQDIEYKSTSDTEVLFNALKFWGVDKAVKKLKGMFAFSWYVKQTKELYLVRDRIGIKPLFYSVSTDKTILFASEVKAILQATNDLKPNMFKVLYSSLGVLERSRKETAWDNVFQVEPGTYLKIDQTGIVENKYYTVFDPVNREEFSRLDRLSVKDVLFEFDELFKASIARMCVSDAEMGAFVSGGIDSSLIAKYATEESKNLKLFTANVLGKHSEYEDASLLAKSLDKPLFDYKYQKETALREWANITWHYESPLVIHFNAIPFSGVSKLTREHGVKAVLTGEGADELFLGYPKLLTKRYDQFLKFPFSILNQIYGLVPKLKSYIGNYGGSQDIMGLFHEASNNFSNELTFQEHESKFDFLSKKNREEQLLTSKMLQDHIVTLLWRNDRMGMINSIESRFPFLDEDVIAFAMNLPSKFKIGRTMKFHNYKHPFLIDKYIVRKLAENKLPKRLVEKKKNGFPTHALRDIYVKGNFFKNGVVSDAMQLDSRKIKYMCNHKDNYIVSLLASVEIWTKLFIENQSVREVTDLISENIAIKG